MQRPYVAAIRAMFHDTGNPPEEKVFEPKWCELFIRPSGPERFERHQAIAVGFAVLLSAFHGTAEWRGHLDDCNRVVLPTRGTQEWQATFTRPGSTHSCPTLSLHDANPKSKLSPHLCHPDSDHLRHIHCLNHPRTIRHRMSSSFGILGDTLPW